MRWERMAAAILAAWILGTQLVAAAESAGEVPFKLYRGYTMVVRGSIGNLNNLNFLIDTGAVPSVLDRRIARKLRLAGTPGKLSVFTQKLDTEQTNAPNVQLGQLHADALPVVVRDLSFAEQALGTRVDAMIGFDFLGQTAFTIDYLCRKIVFGPIDTSMAAISYQARPGYVVVEMQIQHRQLLLLVDTGASDLIFFESGVRDCLSAIQIVGSRTWSNIGGEVRVKQVQLASAALGIMPWNQRDAFILEETGGRPPAGLDGLLGVTSLKARRVAFDPDRKLFAWDQ
jgi:predicted aspartyl protease